MRRQRQRRRSESVMVARNSRARSRFWPWRILASSSGLPDQLRGWKACLESGNGGCGCRKVPGCGLPPPQPSPASGGGSQRQQPRLLLPTSCFPPPASHLLLPTSCFPPPAPPPLLPAPCSPSPAPLLLLPTSCFPPPAPPSPLLGSCSLPRLRGRAGVGATEGAIPKTRKAARRRPSTRTTGLRESAVE